MIQRPKISRKRADELLLLAGLAPSRSQAQALIMAGEVGARKNPGAQVASAGWQAVRKAGELWPEDSFFQVAPRRRYVSRGGLKLEGALEDLGLSPRGWNCLDIGASTGGFTDCLLRHGAAGVCAVDVGRNLMDPRLRRDGRVRLIEGLNARRLAAELPGPPDFDLAVMDVSFISLGLILPQAAGLVRAEGRLLAMVKPQFEVGRAKVGKKGVVRDPEAIRAAVDKISALGPALSPPFRELGRAPSRLTGPEGNQEVFVLFGPGGASEN